mmetsp:Transcript_10598/g.9534  ORF Transcript_10598/g.9534 Transcript_10598/m.9534 type:complete len:361 (-) Transcript_10598:26-1108(-)
MGTLCSKFDKNKKALLDNQHLQDNFIDENVRKLIEDTKSDFNKRLDNLDLKVTETAKTEMDTLKSKITILEGRAEGTSSELDNLKLRISTAITTLSEINSLISKITILEERAEGTSSEMNILQSKIITLEKNTSSDVKFLKSKIAVLERTAEGTSEIINNLQLKINKLESNFDKVLLEDLVRSDDELLVAERQDSFQTLPDDDYAIDPKTQKKTHKYKFSIRNSSNVTLWAVVHDQNIECTSVLIGAGATNVKVAADFKYVKKGSLTQIRKGNWTVKLEKGNFIIHGINCFVGVHKKGKLSLLWMNEGIWYFVMNNVPVIGGQEIFVDKSSLSMDAQVSRQWLNDYDIQLKDNKAFSLIS